MKSRRIAALGVVPLLGAALVGIGPAHADSVNRSVVLNNGQKVCNDGFGNATTNVSYVATKSGSVKISCHYAAGTTNFTPGTKANTFTFGDCSVTDFNGNRIILNSHDIINANGSENMTCN